MIRETVYKCETCNLPMMDTDETICVICGKKACDACSGAVVISCRTLKDETSLKMCEVIRTCDGQCADRLIDRLIESLTATRIMRLVNRDRNAAKKRQEEQSKDTKKTKNQKEGE